MIEYQKCEWYKHQEEWENLLDKKKTFLLPIPKPTNIGSFNPGAIVRHSASGFSKTAITESISIVVPSIFFIVGCIPLRLTSSGDGILLIPEVDDLESFATDRPAMTPRSPREVRIAGLGDAALQALVRLRSRCLLTGASLPSITGIRFSLRTWTKPQKSRVLTIQVQSDTAHRFATEVATAADRDLDRFELALALFPPRVHNPSAKKPAASTVAGKSRKRRSKASVGGPIVESYWIESTVRPFIAENIAQRRDWYAGFDHLINSSDTAKKIGYEHKGLQLMATSSQFATDQERRFIRVLHRAIARIRGKIYRDTLGENAAKNGAKPTQAVFNRWNRLSDQLRISLVGSKTAHQVQSAINELLSRRGHIKELRDEETFSAVHEFLFHEQWERVRNLALFALASYKRPADEEGIVDEDLDNNESK
jgi:CRISPR-associated protein Cas8a1/Csx13